MGPPPPKKHNSTMIILLYKNFDKVKNQDLFNQDAQDQ